MSRPALLAVALLALSPLAAPGAHWQVRLGQLHDQEPAWTQMGRVPGWSVTVSDDARPVIDIGGDEDGAWRGIVMIGRRWTVPAHLPKRIAVSLQYQSWCEMDAPRARSGAAWIAALTPAQWEALGDPRAPEKAPIIPLHGETDWALALAEIHRTGEDVTEWRDAETANLAPALREHAGEEVVLAIVWAAYHFCPEWAKFRDVEVQLMSEADMEMAFLRQVDPAAPGLGDFAAAMQRGDTEAARLELVEHMRTRETPAPPPTPAGSDGDIERADEVLDHVFRLVGTPPTQIGETIKWNEDPHDYDQWAISLNRHSHWLTLGRAYAATGDEKYAREFVAQLNSWIDAMPVKIGEPYAQGPYDIPGRRPLTLDAGIRMAQTWWPVYHYFRASPAFDPDSQLRMLRSFARHAEYLMEERHFHVDSNWGAMEANGLFHIAVMLPELTPSAEWLRTARERLVEAMEAQVYPDGAQIELTPGYHGVTLRNFLGALELARRTGAELPDEWVAGLERMFAYYAAIAMPDGRTPALNDSGWGGVRATLRDGLELFGGHDDWLWVASRGAEGSRPERLSQRLPYAGWNIMRTGWRPTDHYLLFETGPYGRAHQHEDKLGLIVMAGGHRILTEAGTYSYDASDWRRYVLSTRAHNTVMVDGLEQNRRARPETRVVHQPADARWIATEDFDFAEGTYAGGYGPDNAVNVAHTRQVLFVRPEYWIVADTMTPADDAPHTYEALFHLDGQVQVHPDRAALTARHEGMSLHIAAVGSAEPEIEIIAGQTEPVVQGWLPTGRHNELRPIPTAIIRWTAAGPSCMLYALVPGEADERPVTAVRRVRVEGEVTALEAERAGGGRDSFVRRWGGDAAVIPRSAGTPASARPGHRLRTDADVAFVRIDADGSVGRTLHVGGSQLSVSP